MPAKALNEYAKELQPQIQEEARKRGLIKETDQLFVILRATPLFKAAVFSDPWKQILSLPWDEKTRKALELIREKGEITIDELSIRGFVVGWQFFVNSKMRKSGLKHKLSRRTRSSKNPVPRMKMKLATQVVC
jgi:hypothetical protein